MSRVIASVLTGLILGAPLAVVSAVPAQASPYQNCTEARKSNDCDIPSSSDKYQSKLDRDGDGVGCEC